VISNGEDGPDWQSLGRIVSDWQPARLIVGIPTHADGKPSTVTVKVGKFMQELQRYGKPVESTDENFSSREASDLLREQRAQGLRGRIRKETVDSTAAVLIAERWLSANDPAASSRKNRPQAG
jgi:putative Holliday junction resolvase